jgi:tRNA nucleotidyltransferase (CCA-adding enzyme)
VNLPGGDWRGDPDNQDRRMIRTGVDGKGAAPGTSWAHFSHDADIGVVGSGPTKAEAFRQAALAMTAVITEPNGVRSDQPVRVFCQADSDELLLVEWLNTLVYEMAVRRMLFGDFTVEIIGKELRATAYGEPVDRDRHEPAVEIKGATLTALEVAEGANGWRVQCVVDV